jgi:hypothetical protein
MMYIFVLRNIYSSISIASLSIIRSFGAAECALVSLRVCASSLRFASFQALLSGYRVPSIDGPPPGMNHINAFSPMTVCMLRYSVTMYGHSYTTAKGHVVDWLSTSQSHRCNTCQHTKCVFLSASGVVKMRRYADSSKFAQFDMIPPQVHDEYTDKPTVAKNDMMVSNTALRHRYQYR